MSRRVGLAFSLLCLLILSGCATRSNPIIIGFAGELRANEADLGVASRNGVFLAMDEINQRGGVAGRPLELLISDDQGVEQIARRGDELLIEQGAVAIIGHTTSQMTLAGLEATQAKGVVLLSPTASTARLTGIKDLFFRVSRDNHDDAHYLAQRMMVERGIKTAAILYDSDNSAYALPLVENFEDEYTRLGGTVTLSIAFSTSISHDFNFLLRELRSTQPEALLVIASAANTAIIFQHVSQLNWMPFKYASSWAYSEAFLQNGGRAIENVEMIAAFDMENSSDRLAVFSHHYEEKFGKKPNFAAALGYESMQVLAAALEKTGGNAAGLPEALLQTHNFPGLISPLSMNEYGDMQRPLYMVKVINGRLVTVATLERPPE